MNIERLQRDLNFEIMKNNFYVKRHKKLQKIEYYATTHKNNIDIDYLVDMILKDTCTTNREGGTHISVYNTKENMEENE